MPDPTKVETLGEYIFRVWGARADVTAMLQEAGLAKARIIPCVCKTCLGDLKVDKLTGRRLSAIDPAELETIMIVPCPVCHGEQQKWIVGPEAVTAAAFAMYVHDAPTVDGTVDGETEGDLRRWFEDKGGGLIRDAYEAKVLVALPALLPGVEVAYAVHDQVTGLIVRSGWGKKKVTFNPPAKVAVVYPKDGRGGR